MALLALLLALGGNPWDLRCPAMPAEQILPAAVQPAAHGFVSWATLTGARLGKPVVRGRLGFERGAPSCTVSGADVSCGVPSYRWTPALHVPAGTGWRLVRTMLRIGRTGCFRIGIAGAGLHLSLPLAVPGPDWGTSGW